MTEVLSGVASKAGEEVIKVQIVEKQEVWMHLGTRIVPRADFAWFLLTGKTSEAWLGFLTVLGSLVEIGCYKAFPLKLSVGYRELSLGAND